MEFEVPAQEGGSRLDVVVAAHVEPPTPRARIKRWIEDGHVDLDGVVADRPGLRVRAGARVTARPPAPAPTTALPEPLPLDVLYEDPDVVVVYKPAGLVVHPSAGHAGGTLVNAVLHRYPWLPGQDPLRPGIVHRLDKDTSGVMVVTRTELARDELGRRFAAHDVERLYWAIVVGNPPDSGTFETLHGRHPTDRKRFSSRVSRGRRAVTHFRVIERLDGTALVEARLETGRTHQVRVHFADHGWPLLGDPLYGRPPREERLRRVGVALGRQALHARVLGFAHPRTGERLRFETAPPPDFMAALAALRGASGAP
ncbi:MAG: RluA family pseudouridine synthase [Deltaproteobacteria bacterium]|nr:RluA family pseudouridine synthase [Deltaproteobacteria bacterium]